MVALAQRSFVEMRIEELEERVKQVERQRKQPVKQYNPERQREQYNQ